MEGCPRVSALEYHADGNLKRVELVSLDEMFSSTSPWFFEAPTQKMTKEEAAEYVRNQGLLINGSGTAQ